MLIYVIDKYIIFSFVNLVKVMMSFPLLEFSL